MKLLGDRRAEVTSATSWAAATGDDVLGEESAGPRTRVLLGGIATFAADVPKEDAAVMAVTQRPIALAAGEGPTKATAWKTIPSWYLVGRQDRTITPAAHRYMANRADRTPSRSTRPTSRWSPTPAQWST